ncbi:MAG: SM-20-related protein [Luteibaculaceae bacterium]|jgi:SM-20-related protein
MNQEEELENLQFEGLIAGLINDDFGNCTDFILPEIIVGLRGNLNALSKAGDLKSAGIGNKLNYHQNQEIRGDKIHWIDGGSNNEFELIYLQKMEKFMLYLNKTCFTAIKGFESHYASYGITHIYKRHLDQFKNENGRKFSTVLYLNDNWVEEDGGNLSLYPAGKNQVNIIPSGGRLVLFRSDEMEHEVQASNTRNRQSIAGWMKSD